MDPELYAGSKTPSSHYSQANEAAAKPLTLEITDRLDGCINGAAEIRNRLYAASDRLFGAQPVTTEAEAMVRPKDFNCFDDKVFNCFDDAVRHKGRELSILLGEIDRLTANIFNRI
jgi:hypothetical protein